MNVITHLHKIGPPFGHIPDHFVGVIPVYIQGKGKFAPTFELTTPGCFLGGHVGGLVVAKAGGHVGQAAGFDGAIIQHNLDRLAVRQGTQVQQGTAGREDPLDFLQGIAHTLSLKSSEGPGQDGNGELFVGERKVE